MSEQPSQSIAMMIQQVVDQAKKWNEQDIYGFVSDAAESSKVIRSLRREYPTSGFFRRGFEDDSLSEMTRRGVVVEKIRAAALKEALAVDWKMYEPLRHFFNTLG